MDPSGLVLTMSEEPALRPFATDVADHFVLAHHGIPRCSQTDWQLRIDGLVERELTLSIDELRRRDQVELTAVLECAGNPEDPDKPTRFVGNARWRGPLLRDLLLEAGIRPQAQLVWMRGVDWGTYAGVENSSYLKDIPLAKALAGDVVIAHEMNGEPLTPEHGFPLRVVVPGYYGTNSVKWLSQISLAAERPDSLFTTTLYNTLVDGVMTPVWAMAVNSRLTSPRDGELVAPGEVEIAGWAWGEAPVTSVEISVDDGASWRPAALQPRGTGHSWQGFRTVWRPDAAGTYALSARATDATGATQPPDLHINQLHRIEVTVSAAPGAAAERDPARAVGDR